MGANANTGSEHRPFSKPRREKYIVCLPVTDAATRFARFSGHKLCRLTLRFCSQTIELGHSSRLPGSRFGLPPALAAAVSSFILLANWRNVITTRVRAVRFHLSAVE